MRRLAWIPLLALLAGCETERELGRCIGLNDVRRDTTLIYEHSTTNIVIGVLLAETVVVPVIVVLDQLDCPVHRKPA